MKTNRCAHGRAAPRASALAVLFLVGAGIAPLHAANYADAPGAAPGSIASVQTRRSEAADTLHLRLALAERLHVPWARATIIRSDDAMLDIIVVGPETTLADLDKAVRMLLSSYESTEIRPGEEMRGHVSPTAGAPQLVALAPALTRGLEAVRQGDGFEIRDFGSLPSIILDLAVDMELRTDPL